MLPLVCIDVDGTLVGPSGDPTPGVWAAADAAITRGQHLAICTARGAFGKSWDYAQRLDPNGWHIFQTGASLVHTGTGDAIEAALSDRQIARCATVAADRGWILEYYTTNAYAVQGDGELAVDHAALMGVELPDLDPSALDGSIVRVQFVVDQREVEATIQSAPEGTTASAATSPIMPGAAFVSVTANTVSKGTAILRLCGELGISADQVMMIGDGHNDVEAMRVAGHAVAMGNADADARAAADQMVAAVDDDGVAEALALSAEMH